MKVFDATAVAVNLKYVGANLEGDHATAVGVLALTNVFDFPKAGQLAIAGDVYTYTAVDEDTNQVTLSGTTGAAYEDGDRVEVFPRAPLFYATVIVGSDQTGVNALVPFAMVAQLQQQMDSDGVSIQIEEAEVAGFSWRVVDVPGRLPLIDGGYIDPDSTIPPPALTDGLPPAGSPTPVLEAFAIGSLRWSVIPVANVDPFRFRVYADTVDPPTQDAAHLVYDGASFSGTFEDIDGVALLPADPDVAPDPVFVACVEYDADGEAALSATSASAIPRRASTGEISADWVYAGQIEANQIAAGSILTHLLKVGSYWDWDGATSHLTLFADVEHTEPLIQFRPDGSVFRGRVIADDVSVLNGLILQGDDSHVAVSGGVTLDNSVIDPTAAPTLTVTSADQQAWPATPGNFQSRGICWDGSQWLRLIRNPNTGTVRVQEIDTSGAVTATTTLSGSTFTADDDVNSIVKIGSFWYIGHYIYDIGEWRARKLNTSGVSQGSCALSGDVWENIAVGTDGTDLLVAYLESTSQDTTVDRIAVSTFTLAATWTASGGTVARFHYVGRGNFDFGSDRIIIGSDDVFAYTLSGTTLTENTGNKFSTYASPANGGLTWDGTRFVSFSSGTDTVLKKYSSHYPAASEKAWVTYADTDTGSTKHTKDSPQASVSTVKRRYVQVSLPPAPSGAVTPRVYMGLATSSPADTALLLRGETVASRNVLIDPAAAGGVALVRTATVTNKALTSNVATLTTSAAHGLEGGDSITVAGVDATFNGTYTITAVTGTTLSYAKTASNVASTASSGSITNTDTNTFGAGTPAWIKSQTGGLELYGDGVLKIASVDVTAAWDSYTPVASASGGGFLLGNGTITGRWKKYGKTAHLEVRLTVGSTTNFGTGTLFITPPANLASFGNEETIGNGMAFDTSASARTPLVVQADTATAIRLRSASAGVNVTSAVPYTWATGDIITFSATVELA